MFTMSERGDQYQKAKHKNNLSINEKNLKERRETNISGVYSFSIFLDILLESGDEAPSI